MQWISRFMLIHFSWISMNLLIHEKCLAFWYMEEKPHNVVKQKYRKLQFFLSAFISIKLQRTVFWKYSIICRDGVFFFFTDWLTSTCLNSASLRWSFYIMLLIFYRWSANNCFFSGYCHLLHQPFFAPIPTFVLDMLVPSNWKLEKRISCYHAKATFS